MNWSVSKDVQLLKLWIENNRDSAMAFQRGRLKREGGTLSISARKVLVSPLFHEGTYETSIDLEPIESVMVGGQTIWSYAD